VVAGLAACGLLWSFPAIPLASADDLDGRKERVKGDIGQTLEELDQSSAKLTAASGELEAAQARLSVARTHLAMTRGELAAAETLDRQMQGKLDAAVSLLSAARSELVEGRADFAEQEETLGQIAVQSYQSGDPALLSLSMVLTSQDPAELTSQLNSVQNVLDKESVTLDRLEASRILLIVQEEKVQNAKREVAAQRKEAAKNLERKQWLETVAEADEARVFDLTEMRAEAHDAAVRVREADLEHLRGLHQERDRISELLRQRAEEARIAAAVAAAAAAAAEGAVDLGSRPSNGFLDFPVNGDVTSPYGMRFHPIYHRWALHDGTDFGAACGTPIRAAAAGTVLATYYNAGYGNRVIIDNGFHRGVGLATAYNHLSADSTVVGERVARGDIVGYVGSTGYSTGCHLHFMVFENGVAVDPMHWL